MATLQLLSEKYKTGLKIEQINQISMCAITSSTSYLSLLASDISESYLLLDKDFIYFL